MDESKKNPGVRRTPTRAFDSQTGVAISPAKFVNEVRTHLAVTGEIRCMTTTTIAREDPEASGTACEDEDDGRKFFRGVFYGGLLATLAWGLLILIACHGAQGL
jgi:hypothetical protein